MDALDIFVGEGVEDICNGVEHQLHVRIVGAIVVDGEVNKSRGKCCDNVSMRRHDDGCNGLPIGSCSGWLSMPSFNLISTIEEHYMLVLRC